MITLLLAVSGCNGGNGIDVIDARGLDTPAEQLLPLSSADLFWIDQVECVQSPCPLHVFDAAPMRSDVSCSGSELVVSGFATKVVSTEPGFGSATIATDTVLCSPPWWDSDAE